VLIRHNLSRGIGVENKAGVMTPTLMINGRYDSFIPLETSIKPFFETIVTNAADKKIIITDANHFVMTYSAKLAISETLDWLDLYLGPLDAVAMTK
jgi:pimeloyl-ACP methyl ester carboxylesterase